MAKQRQMDVTWHYWWSKTRILEILVDNNLRANGFIYLGQHEIDDSTFFLHSFEKINNISGHTSPFICNNWPLSKALLATSTVSPNWWNRWDLLLERTELVENVACICLYFYITMIQLYNTTSSNHKNLLVHTLGMWKHVHLLVNRTFLDENATELSGDRQIESHSSCYHSSPVIDGHLMISGRLSSAKKRRLCVLW